MKKQKSIAIIFKHIYPQNKIKFANVTPKMTLFYKSVRSKQNISKIIYIEFKSLDSLFVLVILPVIFPLRVVKQYGRQNNCLSVMQLVLP